VSKQAVRELTPQRTDGNLKAMLDENNLLEMPFDFRIYLIDRIPPIFVISGRKKTVFH